MVAYPPLGYGLVGVLSFITTISVSHLYLVFVIVAYGAIGATTYWLALELGLTRWASALSGLLAALAYPLLGAIFL